MLNEVCDMEDYDDTKERLRLTHDFRSRNVVASKVKSSFATLTVMPFFFVLPKFGIIFIKLFNCHELLSFAYSTTKSGASTENQIQNSLQN